MGDYFGESASWIEVTPINDCKATLTRSFRQWFEIEIDPYIRESLRESLFAKISSVIGLQRGWRVIIESVDFYECDWDDFVLEGEQGRFFLHLGVSD
jgi:hypothetical protein